MVLTGMPASFTSPFGGEVDPSSGRVRGPSFVTFTKAPSPVGYAADLSPKGRGAERVPGAIWPHPPARHLPLDGGGWEGVRPTLEHFGRSAI